MHEPTVLGLCQSMGLRGPDLEDAAAEVFANVFRSLPTFQGRSALGTWVYRIAWRTIARARSRRRRDPEPLSTEPAGSDATPLQRTEAAELHRRLWDAVGRLDSREAAAVELHYRRDWPVERVAQALDCPAGTVKTLLFRARGKLRAALGVEDDA